MVVNDMHAVHHVLLAGAGCGAGHLLKHCRRKSRPSLESTSGITGGSFDEAMWKSADTCHATMTTFCRAAT